MKRTLLRLLRLEAGDGTVGWGEAAPFEPYDGVPLDRAIAALSGGGGRRPPQARAAEEMEKLAKRGITPVIVPDNDPDHNPAADKDDDLDQIELFDAAD